LKVAWTEIAESHLDAIYNYIAIESPQYALATIDRVTARSALIAQFPFAGRQVPEIDAFEVREVFEASYRVIYQISDDQVEILAVVHGAREFQELPDK